MQNSFEEFENMFENEDSYDVVSIIDEDGENIECFVIDATSYKNNKYLLVVPCTSFDDEEAEAFVLKQINEQNEDAIYIPITDDNEYNQVLILFQENDTDYEMKF